MDWLFDFDARMTEQEEDEELLSDLNQTKKNVISFDESPAYIKVRLSWGSDLQKKKKKNHKWDGRIFLYIH